MEGRFLGGLVGCVLKGRGRGYLDRDRRVVFFPRVLVVGIRERGGGMVAVRARVERWRERRRGVEGFIVGGIDGVDFSLVFGEGLLRYCYRVGFRYTDVLFGAW